MKLCELLKSACGRLKDAGIDTFILDSEIIISHVLGIERYRLITESATEVPDDDILLVDNFLSRRENREPLAYILKQKEFYSISFYVDHNVLIPRPETELLVDMVIYEAGQNSAVLDLCTGSGAIAVSCKKFRKDLQITASDVSESALAVAERNRRSILGNERIDFVLSDLFDNVPGKFDVIVTNPPYVSHVHRHSLAPELQYEPENALFAENCGNGIISRIISDAPLHLNNGGIVIMELGSDNTDFVRTAAQENFSCSLLRDYSGLERIAVMKLKSLSQI